MIAALNFITVGNEEAITLNNDFLENNSYLIKMLQTVEPNFMRNDLKIEKTDIQNALSASVVCKNKLDGGDESKQFHNRKTNARSKNQDTYFTVQSRFEASKTISSADEFKQRNSQYNKMGTKPHPAQKESSAAYLTFGQILVHLFEKAINVQFQEFQNKLSNQMREFFFHSEENLTFEEDLMLAKFWKEVKQPKITKIWSMVSAEMETVFKETKKSDAYQKKEEFPEIEEVSDCLEPSFGDSDLDSPFHEKQSKLKKSKIFNGKLQESPQQWSSQMQSIQQKINMNEKMINSQTKRLNTKFVDWDEPEEESK